MVKQYEASKVFNYIFLLLSFSCPGPRHFKVCSHENTKMRRNHLGRSRFWKCGMNHGIMDDDEKMLGEGGSKEFGGSEQKYMENHGNHIGNKPFLYKHQTEWEL